MSSTTPMPPSSSGQIIHFKDGLFSGYDAEKRKYNKDTWVFEMDDKRRSQNGT